MGQWGLESCSGDSCWDALDFGGVGDIHEMTQKEVDNFNWDKAARYSKKDILGCVIWFLTHGKKVKMTKLREALVIAEQRLSREVIAEEGWFAIDERHEMVKKEIADIKRAIKNKGIIRVRRVPGLLEHMNS
tara:strand:+ start:14524 stop:14919 length:396 start_codon:yes stop_codon:yes gene_type:complete